MRKGKGAEATFLLHLWPVAIGLVGAFTSGMNILVIVFSRGFLPLQLVANYLIGKDAGVQ